MMLFREAEEGRNERAYGLQVVKASLRDRLTDRGWVECESCEDGLDYPTPSFTESHPLPVPCPDCVEGLVPNESMVEAGAIGIDGYYGGGRPDLDYRPESRAVLVAAARWEREQ